MHMALLWKLSRFTNLNMFRPAFGERCKNVGASFYPFSIRFFPAEGLQMRAGPCRGYLYSAGYRPCTCSRIAHPKPESQHECTQDCRWYGGILVCWRSWLFISVVFLLSGKGLKSRNARTQRQAGSEIKRAHVWSINTNSTLFTSSVRLVSSRRTWDVLSLP